ncbi:hypothetical protein EMCRGX_G024864 [Ephydatia muelleri]
MDPWETVATLLDSEVPYGHRKSRDRAAQLKEKGNAYFSKSQPADTLRAVRLYTEAIFCAPWPAAEQRRLMSAVGNPGAWLLGDSTMHAADDAAILATCIGNRSAAFYDLGNVEDCLADIRYALELGVPKTSVQKLQNRRSNCLAWLKQKDNGGCHGNSVAKELEIVQLESTGFDDLCVRYTEEKGRYMEVTSTVAPGRCVLTEEPFAAVLREEFLLTHCNHCFKEAALIPCIWCDVVGYCGPGCRQLSWRRYHWVECRAMHMWIKVDWRMQLCLRVSTLSSEQIDLSRGVLPGLGIPPNGVFMGIPSGSCEVLSECGLVRTLVTHREEFMADMAQWETLEKMCDVLSRCFGGSLSKLFLKPSATQDSSPYSNGSLKAVFLHHLLQLHCNSHSVTMVTTKQGGSGLDVVGEVVLGAGLYCRTSLFNHSCFPNAICRFSGNRISVCVVQRLSPGDEVTICYGPQVGRMKTADRKAELKKKYYFDCNCVACSGTDKQLSRMEVVVDAFACPSCGGLLESRMGGVCVTCGHTPSCEEMRVLYEKRDELEALYMTLSKSLDKEESRAELLKCHALQSKILCKENRQLAKTRDTLAFVWAQNGDHRRAAHYCKLSCESVEATMGGSSVELGRELHKLALLLFQSGQHIKARAAAMRALSILNIHLSPEHLDCQELTHLLDACTGCV